MFVIYSFCCKRFAKVKALILIRRAPHHQPAKVVLIDPGGMKQRVDQSAKRVGVKILLKDITW